MIAKKRKCDPRSNLSHSSGDIEYLHNSRLYFREEKWGVPFRQFPTGVQGIDRILQFINKCGVSKLLRQDTYTQA